MARRKSFYAMVGASSAKQAAECVNLAQQIIDLRAEDPAHYRRVMKKLDELTAKRRTS